jgi:hypothetical protein
MIVGVHSGKGTTTFKVVDSDINESGYIEAFLQHQRETGCPLPDNVVDELTGHANEMLRIANLFDVGDVVEFGGCKYTKRTS